MNFKMYIIGGLVYVVLAIVLGILFGMVQALSFLTPFALLIAALIAGMYVGRTAQTPMRGAIDGIIAGLIGGIIAGLIANFVYPMPTSTGVSLLDQVAVTLGATIGSYITMLAGFGFFIGAGIILGAVGGFIGKKIKK